MPLKIQFGQKSTDQMIANLRKTIKDGEGLTLAEVSKSIGRSVSQVKKICGEQGWLIKQFSVESHAHLNLLVNEKTLKLCRKT